MSQQSKSARQTNYRVLFRYFVFLVVILALQPVLYFLLSASSSTRHDELTTDNDYRESEHHSQTSPKLEIPKIPTMSDTTQNADLELRGKWQTQQVEKFCRKYELENQLYILPKYNNGENFLYRHLIYDKEARFIYCFLPKAGCTTLRRLVFASQGLIPPPESTKWKNISVSVYFKPTLSKVSFLNRKLNNTMRIYKLKNYFKFVMIRNPLERLVSAYRDKIERPLKFNKHDLKPNPLVKSVNEGYTKNDYFQGHRRLILSKYNPKVLKEWAKAKGTYNVSVDFPSFVHWIVDSKDWELNEHFSSLMHNIAPCRVGYNLFLNFKNYSRDVRLLISKLDLNSDLFVDRSDYVSSGTETHYTLPHYYSQLSSELKRRLYNNRKRELDFYYHLYPEEQFSHVKLLGVEDPVGLPEEYWPYEIEQPIVSF